MNIYDVFNIVLLGLNLGFAIINRNWHSVCGWCCALLWAVAFLLMETGYGQ